MDIMGECILFFDVAAAVHSRLIYIFRMECGHSNETTSVTG